MNENFTRKKYKTCADYKKMWAKRLNPRFGDFWVEMPGSGTKRGK